MAIIIPANQPRLKKSSHSTPPSNAVTVAEATVRCTFTCRCPVCGHKKQFVGLPLAGQLLGRCANVDCHRQMRFVEAAAPPDPRIGVAVYVTGCDDARIMFT